MNYIDFIYCEDDSLATASGVKRCVNKQILKILTWILPRSITLLIGIKKANFGQL